MKEQDRIKQEKDDCAWVVSTEQGRRFMWKILSHCGVYRDIETAGGENEAFKQIGRRQVGLHLLGLISDASEDQIFNMMKEAKQRSIEEKIYHERETRKSGATVNDTTIESIIGSASTTDANVFQQYNIGGEPIF
jgi:hypothetical protein